MWDVVLDAVIDSLKMLPFLFLAYLLLEYLEHAKGQKFQKSLVNRKNWGSVGGALLGCVPQCGFSVAAANLFSGRVITAGTLVAVFISTSDEAIPILLSSPENAAIVIKVLLWKVSIAIAAGLLLDFVILRKNTSLAVNPNNIHEHCEEHMSGRSILVAALKHTCYIFIFILAVLLVLNTAIYLIGEDRLASILMSNTLLQPVIAGLIGFIPNCAPSVILTQLYVAGSISFGSLLAGLITAGGMGIVVLLKSNHNLKQNLALLGYIYLIAVVVGIALF